MTHDAQKGAQGPFLAGKAPQDLASEGALGVRLAGEHNGVELLSSAEVARRLKIPVRTLTWWHEHYDDFPADPQRIGTSFVWKPGDVTKIRAWFAKRPVRLSGVVHGTRSAYIQGCRCDPCTAANTAYLAEYRKRRAH